MYHLGKGTIYNVIKYSLVYFVEYVPFTNTTSISSPSKFLIVDVHNKCGSALKLRVLKAFVRDADFSGTGYRVCGIKRLIMISSPKIKTTISQVEVEVELKPKAEIDVVLEVEVQMEVPNPNQVNEKVVLKEGGGSNSDQKFRTEITRSIIHSHHRQSVGTSIPPFSLFSLTHTDACVCGGFFERFQHAPVFSGLSIPPTLTPLFIRFSSPSLLCH
ncbi:hypothetical protein L1887_10569 [Cichorium endivia]|nr:hypothetical protein L1887_10569 [Cichorium endivia]